MERYVVTVGIDFPDGRRVEAGDELDETDSDLVAAPWLVEQKWVIPVTEAPVDLLPPVSEEEPLPAPPDIHPNDLHSDDDTEGVTP